MMGFWRQIGMVERRAWMSRRASSIWFAVLLVAAGVARAQESVVREDAAAASDDERWSLVLTPYAWFAAQSTDVGGESLRQSFNDLASITNFGAQMRLAARWRRLILSVDLTMADMAADQTVGRTSIDLGVDQLIVDAKAGFKVYDTRGPETSGAPRVVIAF